MASNRSQWKHVRLLEPSCEIAYTAEKWQIFAQIQGGEAINVVLDKAEAFIDIRLLPFQQAQSIVQRIEQKLRNLQQSHPSSQYT